MSDITSCDPPKIGRCSGVTCHVCFQGQRMKQVSCFTLIHFFAYSLTLNMKATCSPRTSVDFQWITLHGMQENRTLKLKFPILSPAKFWVCRKYQTENQGCGIILFGQALFMP
jgi:hypothetical protein